MHFKIRIILLFSAILTAYGMAYAQTSENLVTNPGFEEGIGYWHPYKNWEPCNDPAYFSIDADTACYGSKSLKMMVTNSGDYVLTAQGIQVTPGECYNIGAWIKTENVTGPGAQICIEWNHRDGYWLGGEWSAKTITGTHQDWQFSGVTGVQIPEEAATSATVYLLLIQGSTGVVWFDDVIVEKQVEPLMETFILRPNYRGKILPETLSPEIEVEITLNPEEHALTLEELEVIATLENTTGDIIVQEIINFVSSNSFTINLDISTDTPAGDYDLTIDLCKNGDSLAQDAYPIEKLSQERFSRLTSYIDVHNRFILNGAPFFPIGLYVVQFLSDTSQLDEIANSPFDTLLNYNINSGSDAQITNYLDQLRSRNLKLIFSLIDYIGQNQEESLSAITHKVSTFKNHPAVISWYMNDERGLEYLPELEAQYERVRELDDNHPVWSVHWRKYVLTGEAHTTEILGVDPYPIPNNSVTMVSQMADWAREAGRGYRPLWLVPQIFDWSHYGGEGRPPTREEMRAMTYLAINHDAKGLIYYSYFDILKDANYDDRWEEIKGIASEIDSLRPLLLSTQQTDDNDITCNNPNVDFKLMKEDNIYCLLTVNTMAETITGVLFQNNLAQKPGVVDVLFEGDRRILTDNGNFTDTFNPYEVHVYHWKETASPIIKRVRPHSCEAGKVIRIIGENFGDTQGDSIVHIGKRTLNSNSPRMKLWTDNRIKLRIPKYKCRWFKGKDLRYRKVWVTVSGIDSNKKRLRVIKPDTCL